MIEEILPRGLSMDSCVLKSSFLRPFLVRFHWIKLKRGKWSMGEASWVFIVGKPLSRGEAGRERGIR